VSTRGIDGVLVYVLRDIALLLQSWQSGIEVLSIAAVICAEICGTTRAMLAARWSLVSATTKSSKSAQRRRMNVESSGSFERSRLHCRATVYIARFASRRARS
jgi:hypothetical protein